MIQKWINHFGETISSNTYPSDWPLTAFQSHLQSWSRDTSWCLRCLSGCLLVSHLKHNHTIPGTSYVKWTFMGPATHRLRCFFYIPLLMFSANALMDLVSDKSSFLIIKFSFPVSSKMSVRASSALSRSLQAIMMRAPDKTRANYGNAMFSPIHTRA